MRGGYNHYRWGPAAKKFFSECLELADTDRNVDLYHWSSGKFSSTWYDDWSKRIRDMQYTDHEDYTVGS